MRCGGVWLIVMVLHVRLCRNFSGTLVNVLFLVNKKTEFVALLVHSPVELLRDTCAELTDGTVKWMVEGDGQG